LPDDLILSVADFFLLILSVVKELFAFTVNRGIARIIERMSDNSVVCRGNIRIADCGRTSA
jgi:hypothetical protein